MYVINDDMDIRHSDIYTHPDTGVSERVYFMEDFKRRVDGNANKKETLYFRIKFLEGKLEEVNEDIWYPNSLGNQCSRAYYTRNLECLKKFRKHLYNCEGTCYDSASDIVGMHFEYDM